MIASLWLMPAGRADKQTSNSLFCGADKPLRDYKCSWWQRLQCRRRSIHRPLAASLPHSAHTKHSSLCFSLSCSLWVLSSVGSNVNSPVWCHGCYNVASLSPRAHLAFPSTKLTLWNSYRSKTSCCDTWVMIGLIFLTSRQNIWLSEGLFDWQYQEQEERSAGRASTSGSPTSPCRMTSLMRWELTRL